MKYLQDVYFSNFNVVNNLGGHSVIPRGSDWVLHPKTFGQNKFYFVTGGECDITIGNKSFHGTRGDWFVMPAGVLHSYSNCNENDFSLYYIHFDIYPNAELFTMLDLPCHVKAQEDGRVWELFTRYARLTGSANLVDRITVKSLLLELIAEYITMCNAQDVSVESAADTRIDLILRYINDNLSQELGLGRLAAQFHLHPNHFIRYFKQKTGDTPARYVRMKKMETAKRLLEETQLNISEIMEKVGESDLCGFSKQFKSIYGMSPVNYRKYFRSVR